MTTRRSLLQSGNTREGLVVAAMLDHHETFKSKHIKQNSGLIRRNIDIVKSNLELQLKLDSLKNQNLLLEISRLKLKKEVNRLTEELERIQSSHSNPVLLNDETRQNLLNTVESLQILLGNRLTNQSEPISSPTPSRTESISSSPSNTQPNSNVTFSRRRSSAANQPQVRQNIVSTRPELSYISEGSIEGTSEYGVMSEGIEDEKEPGKWNGTILEGLNEEPSILSQYSYYSQSLSPIRAYQSSSSTPSPSSSSTYSTSQQPLPSLTSPPPSPEEDFSQSQFQSQSQAESEPGAEIQSQRIKKSTNDTKTSKVPPPSSPSFASTSTNVLDFRRPARRVSGLVKPISISSNSNNTSSGTGGEGRSLFSGSGSRGRNNLRGGGGGTGTGENDLEEEDYAAMDRIGRRAMRLSLSSSNPTPVTSLTSSTTLKGKGKERSMVEENLSVGGGGGDIEWDQETELTLVQEKELQKEKNRKVLKEIQAQAQTQVQVYPDSNSSTQKQKGRQRLSISGNSVGAGISSRGGRSGVLSSSSEDEGEGEGISDYEEEVVKGRKKRSNAIVSRKSSTRLSTSTVSTRPPRTSIAPKQKVLDIPLPLSKALQGEGEEVEEVEEVEKKSCRPVITKKNSSNRISAAFKAAEVIIEPEEQHAEILNQVEEEEVEEELCSQPSFVTESLLREEVGENSRASLGGRSRKSVNYALPKLNVKMRRPDGYIPTAPSSTKPRKSTKPPASNGGRSSISTNLVANRFLDESDEE